jgi:3-demethoxyubiquinol 3-hydroxylase
MIKQKIEEIIRVNHAGELGAKYIYEGQIKAFKIKKDYDSKVLVENMKLHEDEHFDYFDKRIISDQVRPTIMSPLWKIGGYGLGFVTAILDKKGAMACTTAVEEVIDEHYKGQLDFFDKERKYSDKKKISKSDELEQKIIKFRDDEIHHRDIGYDHGAEKYRYFKPLTSFIKIVTKTAIAISKKI